MAQGQGNNIDLTIVVNGNPVTIHGNVNAPLQSLLGQALQDAGVPGGDPNRWVFKDAQGNALNKNEKIGVLGIMAGATIFLSLEAGAAG
jgi:hypothetical protein